MKIVIKGIPLQKQSARFAKRGNFMKSYQPKKIINWVAQARLQIIDQLGEGHIPLNDEVFIKMITFKFPPLKSWSKKKLASLREGETIFKNTKPDLDNLLKNLWDACNGLVWVDDARIVLIAGVSKIYSETPEIEMVI